MKSINCQVQLQSIRSRVDKSLGISIVTSELSIPEKAIFLELQNIPCEMTLTPIDEKVEEYKVEKDLDQKPLSVRQRNVLWLLFRQDAEGYEDFNAYYRSKMEKAIEFYKSKLDQ